MVLLRRADTAPLFFREFSGVSMRLIHWGGVLVVALLAIYLSNHVGVVASIVG